MHRIAIFPVVVVTMLVGAASLATAHEFWIDTEVKDSGGSATIVGDLKVGLMFRGESYPYLSDRFVLFTDSVGGQTRPVSGLVGDIPAMSLVTTQIGLHVIAHQTVAFRVSYDDWALFEGYLTEEGLDGIADLHHARGLPETGFAERYIRCAKALVQIGTVVEGDGDFQIGMPFELVAGANPFAPATGALPVRLTWQGAPVANRKISIFRDDGTVTRSSTFTDANGQATIPLTGAARYMLNAVYMEPYDAPPVFWQSHWASLSFDLRP